MFLYLLCTCKLEMTSELHFLKEICFNEKIIYLRIRCCSITCFL